MITLDYLPRVRVEWFLAAARVVVATGALIAVTFETRGTWTVPNLLIWYLVYSLGVMAFVWTPVRFGAGADVVLHVFDLTTFVVLMFLTGGAPGPFFLFTVFLLVCASIRWHVRGTMLTAAAIAASFAIGSAYADAPGGAAPFPYGTFVIRMVYLAVVTALLAYLGEHQRRYLDEIGRLAAWPRTMSREPFAVISEILSRASDILNAPRIVLLWFDADETVINVASLEDGEVSWKQEPPDTFGPPVLGVLTGRTFQTTDAADDRQPVVIARPGRFIRRRCHPVNEQLRARFRMHPVQSWPLEGGLVRGRLFCLDKTPLSLDDLSIGEYVAQLATSRLDGLYLLDRLQDARVLEERVRVARDLHDSLLQSQAGAALQLLAARRMLDRDPAGGRQRLAEVQELLEHGELEMRAFIRDLRPARAAAPAGSRAGLRERLLDQARRVERQWDVKISMKLDPALDGLGDKVASDVYRLVQEGMMNAARHADASSIAVDLSIIDGRVELSLVDDGKGFPFTGVYDLAALERMDRGPVTLRERVAELDGRLTLKTSRDAGTELLITVPLGTA